MIELFGYIGGSILAFQHIPQIVKIWYNRSAHDLSSAFICFNILGLILMLVYAISTEDYPIAIPVGFSLVFSIVLGMSKSYIDSAENSL